MAMAIRPRPIPTGPPISRPHAPAWAGKLPSPTPLGPASLRRPAGQLGLAAAKATRAGLSAWLRVQAGVAVATALLLVAGVAMAALLILQTVTVNPSSKAPPVVFQSGTDYAAINAAGFATLTVGSSGTGATLALSGIPGATSVTLGNLLKLNNQDATHPETVTLSRSATPNAAITSFQVTVKNGASTLVTWDAVSAATSGSFTLPVSTAADVSILVVVADGTAAGALGSFGMQFSLVPT